MRHVLVLMPFGGDDPERHKLLALIYYRLKYLIEERIVTDHPVIIGAESVHFKVDVFLKHAGDIPIECLLALADYDVVLGYVCDHNVTVAYELALRGILRSETVLVLDGSIDCLPFYLRQQGLTHLTSTWASSPEMQQLASARAAPPPDFNTYNAPPPLQERAKTDARLKALLACSDREDAQVSRDLSEALTTVLAPTFSRCAYLQPIVDQFDFRRLLSNARSDLPAMLLRITLDARPSGIASDPPLASARSEVLICDGNTRFRELFCLPERDLARDSPLTVDSLNTFLERALDSSDVSAIAVGQRADFAHVLLFDQPAYVSTVIRFNSKHPDERFRNRAYLPRPILTKRVGRSDMTHYLYLLYIFTDVDG